MIWISLNLIITGLRWVKVNLNWVVEKPTPIFRGFWLFWPKILQFKPKDLVDFRKCFCPEYYFDCWWKRFLKIQETVYFETNYYTHHHVKKSVIYLGRVKKFKTLTNVMGRKRMAPKFQFLCFWSVQHPRYYKVLWWLPLLEVGPSLPNFHLRKNMKINPII